MSHASASSYLCPPSLWSVVLTLICLLGELAQVSGEVVQALEQGFFFDWTAAGSRLPTPITEQCATILIKWGRNRATGPSPTSPYFLQVYHSSTMLPLVIPAGGEQILEFNWTVPFPPRTQYQICMYDINGVTGGCQDIYTVYPSTNAVDDAEQLTCDNVTTTPQNFLGVSAAVSNGPLSEYGWIDQCTDIAITPLNGTPPYILTVAPALHPPFNITLQKAETYNWTVSLSYGMPFFISVSDSSGLAWSAGPLHSGGDGPTDCLSVIGSSSRRHTVAPGAVVGSGIGGLALGLVLGLFGPLCFTRFRHRQRRPTPFQRLSSGSQLIPMLGNSDSSDPPTATPYISSRDRCVNDSPRPTSPDPAHTDPIFNLIRQNGYHVEPYNPMPDFGVRRMATESSGLVNSIASTGTSSSPRFGRPPLHARTRSEPAPSPSPRPSMSSQSTITPHRVGSPGTISYTAPSYDERSPSHIYVVHHDNGLPPVTVYADNGASVVELPPQYPGVPPPAQAPTRPALQHRRYPVASHNKGSRSFSS